MIEHQAARGLAVAAGAARLLVIGLQAAGQIVVDDEADVGLVDAHAEGVGGGDDLDPAAHEGLLGLAAVVGQQAGVIDRRPPLRSAAAMISATSSVRLRVEA